MKVFKKNREIKDSNRTSEKKIFRASTLSHRLSLLPAPEFNYMEQSSASGCTEKPGSRGTETNCVPEDMVEYSMASEAEADTAVATVMVLL